MTSSRDKLTLLFIPDISGYTQFVSETEIRHSRHIIKELLEVLIDSNRLKLQLAEIEGDALLFYKQGKIPDLESLTDQAKAMFINFHHHLKKYQRQRICHCGACRTASGLTLKMIVHAGPVEFINIKNQSKPYGSDVILAHRLLKNSIKTKEYILISEPFWKNGHALENNLDHEWLSFADGSEEYESIGKVHYRYASLSFLHEHLDQQPALRPPQKITHPIITDIYIDQPPHLVFENVIDLERRMKWNKVAKDITFQKGEINQVGTRHVCVFENESVEFESVTDYFGDNHLVYGERLLDLPKIAREIVVYFIVNKQDNGSRVQIQVHYKLKPIIGWVLDPFFRHESHKINKMTLQHLKEWCESINSEKPAEIPSGSAQG